MKRRTARILTFIAVLCSFAASGHAASRVWVAEGEGMIEYDPSTWAKIGRIEIPGEVSRNPERFQATHSGAMLFRAPSSSIFEIPKENPEPEKAWIWNGRMISSLEVRCTRAVASAVECRESVQESCPGMAMSKEGRDLFWFANEYNLVRQVDGPDISASTVFRIWETDLSGEHPVQLATFAFPPCVCATGVCVETCPEASLWFPAGGIDDFFIVNHFIPGQLSTTYQGSYLYRRIQGDWIAEEYGQAFETVLDADQGGNRVLHAIHDSGCCGWDNDSNDQTLLTTEDKSLVIFDERQRYSNSNYDVSFYTSMARLSPGGSKVAISINISQYAQDPIRLSSSGTENSEELARIQKAIESMPSVEVIQASNPGSPLMSIPNTTLAGWLNEKEILLVREGVLVQCDTDTGTCQNTPVNVGKDDYVFIR
ncbi:MAG: hypothetical protein P8Z37_09230 [Acidobacteriota bacterium]